MKKHMCTNDFARVSILLLSFCSIICLTALRSPLQNGPSDITWSNIQRFLQHEDVELRRQAARYLAVNEPENHTADIILPLAKQAIADADGEVKSLGVAGISRFAWAHASRTAKATGSATPKLNLGQDEELYRLLLSAAQNSDLESVPRMGDSVGWTALFALTHLYWDNPQLEKDLIEVYRSREGKARYNDIQKGVIEAIGYAGFSSEQSREILLSALHDDHGSVQQRAARTIASVRPQGGLEALINAFISAENVDLRWSIMSAMLDYDPDTTKLIAKLQQEYDKALERADSLEKMIEFAQNPDYEEFQKEFE